MQGIFISYRRQDAAGYAGRLHERLASHFGKEHVFMDVEGIEPGVDFVEALETAVASCEVLIVIIGAGWLATDKTGKRRLDDPKDFVHIETAAALARHIRVVPVLVDGAVMPREEELPANLKKLARRQAVELSNKHWDATTAELIRTLERTLDGDKLSPATYTRGVRRYWVIGGMAALIAVAVGIYRTLPWEEPATPAPQAERPAVAPPADTVAARTPEKTAPTAEKPPAAPEKPAPEKPAPEKTAPDKPAPEKTAPPPEKAVPLPKEKPATPPPEKVVPPPTEKRPAPAPEKVAPRPTEKPATPPVAKAEVPAPARAPEKPAPAEPSPTAKPSEKPSAPVAVAPTPAPPVAPPVAPAAALPAALPRVGDTWEYRMRSKWQTVQPRTYVHRVTAVSAREVAQTISVDSNSDGAAARQAVTPDTRFVEWRGQGFYLLEFNPFLEAFGEVNAAATLAVPAMPPENPYHAGWYGRGRVRGYESVSVPAGTFKALKVEIDSNRNPTEGLGNRSREPVRALLTVWYAPEVKRTVKMLRIVMAENGMHLDEDTYELVRYRVQ